MRANKHSSRVSMLENLVLQCKQALHAWHIAVAKSKTVIGVENVVFTALHTIFL